ncbi:hypothetical protein [Nonomuraea sp. NPDC048916]|uniref:hypothetical protein n=1 Tax=Nonomuraea sp. NPDC048916 TaxID=3154232 RepID=UPI0033C402BA
MRRLITSRGIWLALAATLMAAAIVVIVRSRHRSAPQRPGHRDEAASPTSIPVQTESEPVTQWPPVPVLGTPTAEDLRRYAAKPSVFDSPAFARTFGAHEPREPLDAATRRRLTRWGVAGLMLLLLAGGTQVLESVVFAKEPPAGVVEELPHWHPDEFQESECGHSPNVACYVSEFEYPPFLSDERFP